MRRGRDPKSAKSKVEATPPVTRMSPKGDGARGRDLEERLAESLKREAEAQEQQAATAEILRVISQSRADVQPVFDAIANSAVRICDAAFSGVFRFDGSLLHLTAHAGLIAEELSAAQRMFPARALPGGIGLSRVVLNRTVVHIADIRTDAEWQSALGRHTYLAPLAGYRTFLAVPLLHDDVCLGAINVWRRDVSPFSDKQIELLKTFADQAVIAIENVRLFKELESSNRDLTRALDRETATSEILRVISSSPTDVQPVFDAIVRSASALCHAPDAIISMAEGNVLRLAASVGTVAAAVWQSEIVQGGRLPLTRGSVSGRAFIDQRTVHVHDVSAMSDDEFPEGRALQRAYGGRGTTLSVPLLRDSVSLGAITLVKDEVSPFTDEQIALLQTFADQAVIALENTRLFNETKEALEQRTATSEILRVIASSPIDLQPVLDAVAERAARVCSAADVKIHLVEGDTLRLAAQLGPIPSAETRPIIPTRHIGCAVLEQRTIHVLDMRAALDKFPDATADVLTYGVRTSLATPLRREGVAIGVIQIRRLEVEPFSEKQITLLETFADQAVIAIENVRLFNELEVANRELAAASQQKSEFLANMSHELRTPLNAIIGFSEVLTDRMFGELNGKQEEYLKDIYASGNHLLSLINDILDLSKIEAGRMELELTEFDLPTAIDNALMLIRERAGRRSIALQTDIDGRLGQVQADERKVRQVVLNLLSNAIKFTPEGGRIDVSAVPKDGFVEVSVRDTGIGIAPEDQEKVFEEFRQVGTAAKKIEGTGLGLTLCRKFVELHGGKIWVKSQLGTGSTFTFTIPVRPGD